MTYDPHTIAREAAHTIWDAGYKQFLLHGSDVAFRDFLVEATMPLILTAAARMVRESGAREALELVQNHMVEIQSIHRVIHDAVIEEAAAALANLAKLGGRG